MHVTERKQADILGVMVDRISMNDSLDLLDIFVVQRRPRLIATANAEMVMMAQDDPELFNILKCADLVLPDGA